MALEFTWDANKAASSLEKHGVSFEEASTAFGDPLSITVHDPNHSEDETRFVLVGLTFEGKPVIVVHVELEDSIRIISAREATRLERNDYEQG